MENLQVYRQNGQLALLPTGRVKGMMESPSPFGRVLSSGMQRHVVRWKSEDFNLLSYLAYLSTLKMEAECSSETSVWTEYTVLHSRWYKPSSYIYSFAFEHPVALMYLLVYLYISLKYNLLSCHTSLSLDVSAVHGHHQVHISLTKHVPLHFNIAYRVRTRCCLLIKIRIKNS
jgi:hypothetical protein